MERKKKRWLLVCVLVAAVFGVALLGAVAWLGWAIHWEWTKPGPVVEVVTFHPGMTAASIEKSITNRIERWVIQSPGAELVTSRSRAGVSVVRVSFRNDVDPTGALTMTEQLATGTLPTLPPHTLPPVVLPRLSQSPIGVLVVHGAAANEGELRDAARIEVRLWLSGIEEGAVAPVVLGGKDRTILVFLKPAEMEARHLSAADVVVAIRKGNKMVAPGVAYFGDNQLLLDSNMMGGNIRELMDLSIRSEQGKNVFLRDIGRVADGYAPQTLRFRLDGLTAVGVPVYPRNGASPKAVAKKISNMLPSLGKQLPPKIEFRWVPFGVEGKGWWSSDDDGLLTIYLRGPPNASLDATEKRVAAVEHLLETNIPANERAAFLSEVGLTPDMSAAYTANAGPMDATIYVQLSHDRTLSAAAYASKLRRRIRDDPNFADLGIRFASRDMPASVDVRITGEKREEAMRLVQEIRQRLTDIKGAVDVDIAQRMDVEIDHASLQRVLDVRANIEERNRRDVIADIRKMLQELKVPEGMRVNLMDGDAAFLNH